MARTRVCSEMVEFHRLGGESAIMEKGRLYIRTMGFDKPAAQIALDLDHEAFMTNLNTLRYVDAPTAEEVEEAKKTLADQAGKMVPPVDDTEAGTTFQIDLVTGAAELWAFPFEAVMDGDAPLLANENRRVVLTRRIRDNFADHKIVWPTRPRVLFVHAEESSDLDSDLIGKHVQALKKALWPWKGGAEPDETLLTVREVKSLADLEEVRKTGEFTHIHILAHGQAIKNRRSTKTEWGLRFGSRGADPERPQDIARALCPQNGLPVVITLASCDSANQLDSAIPTYSLSQELHRGGVPVVVGSQFPLSKPGSIILAECFYEPILRGEDVRNALHDVRVKLHKSAGARHDWLSVVCYVRLPEGYADRLAETTIATELQMLEAARRRANAVLANPTEEAVGEVEELLRARIHSLEEELKELNPALVDLRQECEGLLASAHKSMAELYFRCGGGTQEQKERVRKELETALDHYRNAFRANIHNHWVGMQQLALEAVLNGRFAEPSHWSTVLLGAQFDKDRNYWAYGTIAEIEFLRVLAGQPADPNAVQNALNLLKKNAKDKFAIESTRRQFARYLDWWTSDNGFFPERTDFRQEAQAFVQLLT